MSRQFRFGPVALVQRTVGSLEKRLVGALILILLSIGTLQFLSQDSALQVRDASAALARAAGETEQAQQLVELVGEFRIATNLELSHEAAEADGEKLTDIAIRIGEQVNALRLAGMPLYEFGDRANVFQDLDRHVARISQLGRDDSAAAAILGRNQEMAALASSIADMAALQRAAVQQRLDRAVDRWHLLVSASGASNGLLVLLILLDLLRNILPALRRMHRALRRLANGELNLEVETFRLQELQKLSGPLEIFRQNALAVKNLAFTDPSTGMHNRRAFVDLAGKRLADCRGSDRRHAMMAADIDRFKHVNDDFGHPAGDQLVRLIGDRMTDALGDRAIIARLGGDEFAIFTELTDNEDAMMAASRLVVALRDPFDLGDFTIAITASMGVVELAAGEADEIDLLLARADLALYAAKNEGRNRAVPFTAELEAERELDRALQSDLASAIMRGQLRVVYQPIHPIGDDQDEIEALVRWTHPKLGDIPPSRFIPAAERSGLMTQLGQWIIDRALTDLRQWPDLVMSLNLSPLQLQQDGFVHFVLETCRRHEISPRRLILEVTESLSIERNSRALLTLDLLRNAGFRIALDDFGTGYSSLSMMKDFHFDRLKLDRSLIMDLGRDSTSKAVFEAAVTMALKIGAQVVAEGISEQALIDPALDAGCTHLQGFHISRPIEATAVAPYFASRQRIAA
ncbi:GGDEF domain-containing protein [Altererythrobacter sp. B11]|uniref:putative bifunctional diguanylate cyclase/phosphodiesterase n=1 Tax=Altererythrobacter sp. B11 TaxID=2060312 RepID=UPI000DC7192B|nr:bifunctional diguanylate cyclase/phosphodiesterase [Altererythrobacter sp. B11]BBC72288.1 GGDEF domain-containing protein [Altererythrobacter sp. B11]